MKKFLVSSVFVIAFVVYIYSNQSGTTAAATAMPALNSTTSNPTGADATPAGAAPPTNDSSKSATVTTTVPVTTKKSTGQYKDGTYTGPAANAYYGNIQVAAVISGGRLTDVRFLQYPNDRRESISISQESMPILKSEAIAAQSANVSGVSGASDTSDAFKQSLSAALRQAS